MNISSNLHDQIRLQIQQGGTIRLGEMKIGDDEFSFLCQQSIDNVQKLHIYLNSISPRGMISFQLGNWSSLTQLWLSNNRIGNIGCRYLTMASLEKLQTLSLRKNGIGLPGFNHLFKAKWSKITVIYLGYNEVGPGGLQIISKSHWPNLKQFYFNYSRAIVEEAFYLTMSFTTLEHLQLVGNYFSEKDKDQMDRVFGIQGRDIELFK